MLNKADLTPVLWEQPCIYGFATGGSGLTLPKADMERLPQTSQFGARL